MTTTITFDSTVFGGLPCIVEAHLAPAEPDVGLPAAYVDEIDLYFRNGREFSPRLYAKAEKDMGRLAEEALEAGAAGGHDDGY